jgi:hypothetical protein
MLGLDGALLMVLGLAALALKVWALADAVYRPGPYYEAAGKWNKVGWVAVLAVALLLTTTDFSGLFGLVAVVAAVVYLVDVRPAVRALKPGSSGPYG